jgi:hypothetical protein
MLTRAARMLGTEAGRGLRRWFAFLVAMPPLDKPTYIIWLS